MSWHSNQLRYALGLGGLVSFYGLVTVIIFVAGNQFKIDLPYQIVIVALVLLTLPFALVIGYFATRKKKPKEIPAASENKAAEENGASAPQKLNAPSGRFEELNAAANTAFQFLQSSDLAANGARGKEAVYALPFFLFAGAPRSGKTSLVLSSAFNFHTLPNQRQSEQNVLRPTRHADWRVSSEAVMLDTAGRYQTEGEMDAEEWSALVEILKKSRTERPLDGLVLVANAEKLLAADDTEIEQQAKLLRARLDETIARTKTRFPVYVVFSNADAIEGFRDSFSVSQREGKNLLLGATFPLDKAEGAGALFDAEFEAIHQALRRRRLFRLSAPFPPVRQLRIFNFPSHFGAARKKLGHFVGALFRPNPFSQNPMFRGFYFTASLPQNNQVGANYFAEKFFRDVLLRDKDLAATFQAQRVRRPVAGWLLLALGSIIAVALLAMTGYSLYLNKQMLDVATTRANTVQRIIEADKIEADKGKTPLDKDLAATDEEITALENLQQMLVVLDQNERSFLGAPIWMRFGMYSGDRLLLGDAAANKGLFGVYLKAVEKRYKQPVVAKLQEDLRKFAATDAGQSTTGSSPEEQQKEFAKYYKKLQAYLMLTREHKTQAKAQGQFLREQLEEYWNQSVPPELAERSNKLLPFFASQVDRKEIEPIDADAKLITDVRNRLEPFTSEARYYYQMTTDINAENESYSVSLNKILAGNPHSALLESDERIPASFTIIGYRDKVKNALAEARNNLGQADWVLNKPKSSETATEAQLNNLRTMYFNEYAERWSRFARSIKVAPFNDKETAANNLQALGSSESPFDAVLKTIVQNTNLAAKPTGWWESLMSYFQPNDAAALEKTKVVTEFKPLFDFVKAGNNEFTNYVKGLEALATVINSNLQNNKELVDKIRPSITVIESKVKLPPADVGKMLEQPLENLQRLLGADAQQQLEKTWREQIFPEAQAIERGYPFTDAGEADLVKLTAFLNNANGRLSNFYTSTLNKYFEEANGQYRVKDASEIKNFNPEFVTYLNNAFRLREALYGKGAVASFKYQFALQPIKENIIEAQIDGFKIDSEGTRSVNCEFPARAGAETGAIVRIVPTGEPATTSGTNAPNANSSANSNATGVNPQTNNANARSNFLQANSQTPAPNALRFQGQWGLFRLFDAGTPSKQPGGEYNLTLRVGNKIVAASVRPTGGDLFDRNLFRSVRAPQNILR